MNDYNNNSIYLKRSIAFQLKIIPILQAKGLKHLQTNGKE